jgi:hypothetical protein
MVGELMVGIGYSLGAGRPKNVFSLAKGLMLKYG